MENINANTNINSLQSSNANEVLVEKLSVDKVQDKKQTTRHSFINNIKYEYNKEKTADWFRRKSMLGFHNNIKPSIEHIVNLQIETPPREFNPSRGRSILSIGSFKGSQRSVTGDRMNSVSANYRYDNKFLIPSRSPFRLMSKSISKKSELLQCDSEIEMEQYESPLDLMRGVEFKRGKSINKSKVINQPMIQVNVKFSNIFSSLNSLTSEYFKKYSSSSFKNSRRIANVSVSPDMRAKFNEVKRTKLFQQESPRVSRFCASVSSSQKPDSVVTVANIKSEDTKTPQFSDENLSGKKRLRSSDRLQSNKSIADSSVTFNPECGSTKYIMNSEKIGEKEAPTPVPFYVPIPQKSRKSSIATSSRRKRNAKAARKYSESEGTSDSDYNKGASKGKKFEKLLKCPHCSKTFTAQGLGGHKAKAHPGLNISYQEKIKVREENKINLEILREAQKRIKLHLGNPNLKNSQMSRSMVEAFKKQVRDDIESGKFVLGQSS